ncbi:Uncharacterised protein [Brevundimonas diminuta]|nr:hypothetical protein BDIM_02960 [Brevundimonas diminuta ATCC 11568]SUW17012.1 Uncharacterised protein [Brevundimonas diminuta]
MLQEDGFGLGCGVSPEGRGGDVEALPLSTAAFLSHEVGGDTEEKGLGVTDLASGLVGRNAEVGLLDNVLGALDAKLAEAG